MIPLSIFDINLMSEHALLFVSVLIFVAIMMTKMGRRFGVPTLLVFLLLGLLVGQDGLGFKFENYEVAQTIGHFAMTVIILRAGLETSLKESKPIIKPGIWLSTLGVILTVAATGAFIYYLIPSADVFTGYVLLCCLTVAAILSSSDSAVVFSALRSKHLKLRENLSSMLEFETSVSDPVAFVLTAVFVAILGQIEELRAVITNDSIMYASVFIVGAIVLVLQIIVGLLGGFIFGYLGKALLNRIKLENKSLYAILILSIAFFTSGLTEMLGGNELVAIYVFGIIVSNKVRIEYRERQDIKSFFEGISWLVQLLMFLVLGILVKPSLLPGAIVPGVLIGLFMMFIARPISVFLTLLPFRKFSWRAKTLISWVGMKGAGPILFSLSPVVAGLEFGQQVFNAVFIVTILSLLLQGMTMVPMARWLKLTYDEDPQAETFGLDMPEEMGMLRDHVVTEADLVNGNTVRDMHLPHGIRIVMIRREGRFLVPHGSMPLQPDDHLILVMGDTDD